MKYVENGKEAFFTADNDADIPFCKNACLYYLRIIGDIENNAKAQAELDESSKVEAISQEDSSEKIE